MKIKTPLIALTLLALVFAGCSKHSPTASALPKNIDLGVIEVSGGIPSSHILADGRVCTITPSILADGNVKLATTIIETNASGVKRSSLDFESPVDRAVTFAFDKDTVFTVTLHIQDGSTRNLLRQPVFSIAFTNGPSRYDIIRQLEQAHATVLKDSPELVRAEFQTPQMTTPMQVELNFSDGKLTKTTEIRQ